MKNWKSLGLTGVALLMAGITSSPVFATGATVHAKHSSQPVTVTLLTWENPQTNQQIMLSMAKFEKANPGIKIQLVPSPLQDYGTKLNSMIAAGQAPDIFELGNDNEQQWGAQGLLYNYLPQAKQIPGFLNHFYPGAVVNWEANGALYGLPSLMNVYGIFYNKTLFEKAHIPFPNNGWTYQEMFNDAQKLSGTVDGIHQYGLYNTPDQPFNLGVYAFSAGGMPFANSITNATFVTAGPQFVQGLKLFQKYIKSGAVTGPNFSNGNDESLFLEGKLPMWAAGQWNAEQMVGPGAPKNLNWGFVANPIVKRPSTIYDCVGWASPKNVKNPAAVFKVIQYLDTTQYAQSLPGAPVAPPAYKPSSGPYYHVLLASGHKDIVAGMNWMLDAPGKQPVRFLETWANQANQFISADWNNLLTDQTPISTLQQMTTQINSVIKMNHH